MTNKTVAERLWSTFRDLARKVQKDHIEQNAIGGGHDFLHALMVAQYGWMIAERKYGLLAWVAGICHNTDRLFPEGDAESIVRGYLNQYTEIIKSDKKFIIEAVLNHSKLNDPNDHAVTIALKDADRLANIGALTCIRAGQFRFDLPGVDPVHLFDDPKASYKDPKSAARNICFTLEWEPWMRLPKAKELAKPYFDFLREFLGNIEQQLRETGLYPYPEGLI